MEAFSKVSKALPQTWDGDTGSFLSFIINLHLRAFKIKWHAIDGSGILKVDEKNIFTEFHSITDANIIEARQNCTNARPTQNSKALYQCLESSISGALKTTIFSQTENIPKHEDWVNLFKSITNFTAVSSFQLSNLSLQQILDFDPAELHFQISNINTKLIHLFMLATTKSRVLDQNERIQHTLNAYGKILHPQIWAQWTRNQVEAFENSTITDCQMFMNSAVLKYNQITSKDGKFVGSLSTVQEDIITMIATQSKSISKSKSNDQQDNKNSRVRKKQPPFIKDTHSTKNGKQHKIGGKQECNKTTYYFCDCPNHLNSAHWHTHKTEECRSQKYG